MLWTPDLIATRVYLGPADPDTVDLDVDGNYEQISDQSSNNIHVGQSVAAARPSVGAINGLGSILFDATKGTQLKSAAPIGSGIHSVFYIQETSKSQYIAICQASGGNPPFCLVPQQGSTNTTISNLFGSPTHMVDGQVMSWANRGAAYLSLHDRVSLVAHIGGSFQGWENLGLSAYSSSAWHFTGGMGEVLIVDGVPDTELRQRIEGWAAHKRGIQGQLASSHPFRDHPPMVLTVSGVATVQAGGPVDYVRVFTWPAGPTVGVVQPDAGGQWQQLIEVAGEYGVTYLAAGCQPITHGPYTVPEPD